MRCAAAPASNACAARQNAASVTGTRMQRLTMMVSAVRQANACAQSFGMVEPKAPSDVLLINRLSLPEAIKPPALADNPVVLRVIVESDR